jgi:hypothetical protein
MDLIEIGLDGWDWTGMAQDRYSWRALVNTVMNLQVPQNVGNYRVATHLVVCRVTHSSTELVIKYRACIWVYNWHNEKHKYWANRNTSKHVWEIPCIYKKWITCEWHILRALQEVNTR